MLLTYLCMYIYRKATILNSILIVFPVDSRRWSCYPIILAVNTDNFASLLFVFLLFFLLLIPLTYMSRIMLNSSGDNVHLHFVP